MRSTDVSRLDNTSIHALLTRIDTLRADLIVDGRHIDRTNKMHEQLAEHEFALRGHQARQLGRDFSPETYDEFRAQVLPASVLQQRPTRRGTHTPITAVRRAAAIERSRRYRQHLAQLPQTARRLDGHPSWAGLALRRPLNPRVVEWVQENLIEDYDRAQHLAKTPGPISADTILTPQWILSQELSTVPIRLLMAIHKRGLHVPGRRSERSAHASPQRRGLSTYR